MLGRGSTLGRGNPGVANSGRYSWCCGTSSVILYQGAFEPTKMCACGLMPRSPSSGPAGSSAKACVSNVIGTVDPQTLQLLRTPCGEDWYLNRASSPRTQRKPSSGADTYVANAAPWCLRHIEQWQLIIELKGSSAW